MGLIPDDVISEIRDRADIVTVIGQHVQLRKAGHNHKGLCPFHNERSPSFNVNSDKQFFYCFGCHKKGDVFTFIMEYEGKSFTEAAETLAAQSGVVIPEDAEPEVARQMRSERARLLEINKLATGFFRDSLSRPEGAKARAYLEARGIGDETAEHFMLGYAPDEWHALGDFLSSLSSTQDKVPVELAIKLGLVARQPNKGGVYDRFRDRLMCPIILPGGEIAGFSGRRLADTEESGAKYINSPESPVYKKSKLLFGLHRAREGFRQTGRAILVEGNFDVIGLHHAGFRETVAPLGTALTEQQADLLRRLADKVVLMYDGDGAGRAATLKGLETLVAADANVVIATIPAGEDPDSIVRSQGPEALTAIVDRAQPGVEYFIYEVWSRSASSADGRAAALEEASRVVANVANPTKRDLITGTLAAAMGLDVGLVRRAVGRPTNHGQSHNNRGSLTGVPTVPAQPLDPPPRGELTLMAILADHPHLMETAEQQNVFSLLTDARLRDMYCAARQGESMLSAAPEELSSIVAEHVLAGSYAAVDDPTHCLIEATTTLRSTRKRSRLAHLQRRAVDAKRRGDAVLERELVREILTTRRQVD